MATGMKSPGKSNIRPCAFAFTARTPDLFCRAEAFKTIFYRVEQSRGYECRGALWSSRIFRRRR